MLLLLFLLQLQLVLVLRDDIIDRIVIICFLIGQHILTSAICLINRFIRYYKIIVMLPRLHVFLLRTDNSAAIFFVSLTCHKPLRIYDQLTSNHLLHTFHYCYLKNRSDALLFFGYENTLNGLVDIHRIQ